MRIIGDEEGSNQKDGGQGTLKLVNEVDDPRCGVARVVAPLLLAAAVCRRTESADIGMTAT